MSTLLTLNPQSPNQTSEQRLGTDYAFSKVEAVPEWDVASIRRAPHSLGAASATGSTASRSRFVSRAERCFITKSSSYAHEQAHWVNAVRADPLLKKKIEGSFKRLGIVHAFFNLNDATNLTNLDRGLHVMLDKYAFFAVTCSLTTLNHLIDLVEAENAILQTEFDDARVYTRRFVLNMPPFSNAQYELVALHPQHLVPAGNVLTVYDHASGQVSRKTYVAAPDRTLRESPGTDDTFPRLPSFSLDSNRRVERLLNPFLVVLNAEIKFRRYLRMSEAPLPPADVMELIRKTIELVDLIYWQPSVRLNTAASAHLDELMLVDQHSVQDVPDLEFGLDMRTGQEEEGERTIHDYNYGYGRDPPGVGATLAERRDYGQYLISGREYDLDSEDEELLEELQFQGRRDGFSQGGARMAACHRRQMTGYHISLLHVEHIFFLCHDVTLCCRRTTNVILLLLKCT